MSGGDLQPVVQITMTDDDVMGRVSALLKRKSIFCAAREAHWKDTFRIAVRGAPAIELMKALRPLMGKRRKMQIDRAIARYSPQPDNPVNRRYKWPSMKALRRMHQTMSLRDIAKVIGCSHPIVRRRLLRAA